MELDVVDLDAPLDEQVGVVDRACRERGFLRVPMSAVDRAVADEAWLAAQAFFALPDDEKQRVAFPEPGYPYGHSPYRFETLARSRGEAADAADLKESLSVGPDCGAHLAPATGDDDPSVWVRSPSLWPERPAGLRGAWERYYAVMTDLAARLLGVMAVALDLSADHFAPLIDRHTSAMRAIRYPALTGDHSEALRASAHSDYGTLTILRTDGVAGLEIQGRDGAWEPITPDPEMLVVNLGDSIAQWTNDRWRSTVHRVNITADTERHSFAFFHMANWDAVIECLPTCIERGERPRYEPEQAGPWLMRKFQATVPSPPPA